MATKLICIIKKWKDPKGVTYFSATVENLKGIIIMTFQIQPNGQLQGPENYIFRCLKNELLYFDNELKDIQEYNDMSEETKDFVKKQHLFFSSLSIENVRFITIPNCKKNEVKSWPLFGHIDGHGKKGISGFNTKNLDWDLDHYSRFSPKDKAINF